MELSLVFLALSMFFKMSSCVRCFKCVPEQTYDGSSLCEDFDGSERFLEDCNLSTMCFKRVTTLQVGNGMTSTTVQRGCAQQTLKGDQARVNGKWQYVNTIYEVYNEDCKEDEDFGRPTKTVNCYCRDNLCNTSHYNTINYKFTLFIIILYLIS